MIITAYNLYKSYKNKPRLFTAAGLFGMQNTDFALCDINFSVRRGECIGIIGNNGSGKSTLLKLICGITSPTSGKILVNGKISALLELGTSFNPEYTGISNIYLNGAIQGLSKKEIKSLIPEISAFADIGDYINKPVKTYSDGMFLRLAFACAVATSPDILIIDEALAVGDFSFRQKCFAKIKSMIKSGVTIIMVSHDIDAIRQLCPRTIWLADGRIAKDGDTTFVSAAYMEHMTGCVPVVDNFNSAINSDCISRFGSVKGSVISVSAPPLAETGKKYKIVCKINIPNGVNLNTIAFSMSFKNSFGLDLWVISSADYGILFDRHGVYVIETEFVCPLCRGEYSLSVSLEDRAQTPIKYYDYAEGIAFLRVVSEYEYFGVFHTSAEMKINEENKA